MAFVEGVPTQEELAYVVDAVKGPVLYNMIGISPILPLADLKRIGVSIIGFGMAHMASNRALWDYAHSLKSDGAEAQIKFLNSMKGHPLEDDHAFAGFPKMRRMEEKYLRMRKFRKNMKEV